jgi:amino acid transporter
VRGFSTADTIILAIGNIVGPSWVPAFAAMWFIFPGVNIPLSFVLCAAIGVFHGLYYALITTVMPRSGGGTYIPLSRAIHPLLGMAMSSILVVSLMFNLGLIASIIVTVAIASPLTTFGTITSNTGLQTLGSMLSTPTWALVAGSLVIFLVGLIAVAGVRVVRIVNKIAFIVGTVGMVAMVAVLVTLSQPQFQSAFNSFAGAGQYENIIATAHASGWSVPSNYLTPTLLSLPLTFFMIIGYQTNTYYAGEIKRVNRNVPIAVLASILYAAFFYSIIATLMTNSFGADFITSAGYLFNAVPSKYPLSIAPWVNNFITIANSSPIVLGLVIANFVSFGYLIIMTFYVIISRQFLAWAFDRAIPSFFGEVSSRFHTPVRAIIITGVVGWIALLLYIYAGPVTSTVNIAFMLIVSWLLDGLAGIAIVRKKHLWDSAPPIVKRKIGGIPVIALLGAYGVVFMTLLFIASLYNPAVIGPFGLSTATTIVIAVILGLSSLLSMKAYLKRKGLDISMVFSEIPPE